MNSATQLRIRPAQGLVILACFHLFLWQGCASSSGTVIQPGGTVEVTVGEVTTGSWLGQPFWKPTNVIVKPQPVILSNGQQINWTARDTKANGSQSLKLDGSSFDKDNGLRLVRQFPVNITFEINNDDRLLGEILSAKIEVWIEYQVDENGFVRIASDKLEREVNFRVSTAEELRAHTRARMKLVLALTAGIILLLILTSLALRYVSRPVGLGQFLNDWRAQQRGRLGDSSIVCPSCNANTPVLRKCSQCGSNLLKGRTASRLVLAVFPVFIAMMIVGVITNATAVAWMIKNTLAMGTGGLLIILIILSIVRSMFKDMSAGAGAFLSALLLPASTREKYVRFANRLDTDKAVPLEKKARAYCLALCEPFLPLSEFHMLADTSCGVTFWKKTLNDPELKPETQSALTDLVFVESLQSILSSRFFQPSGDARIETLMAASSDSQELLKVAERVRLEAEESQWISQLLTHLGTGIAPRASQLAEVLTSAKATSL